MKSLEDLKNGQVYFVKHSGYQKSESVGVYPFSGLCVVQYDILDCKNRLLKFSFGLGLNGIVADNDEDLNRIEIFEPVNLFRGINASSIL